MDSEEERVLYLTRVGREKIFKYGTYNLVQQRPITQDHPYYVQRDDVQPHVCGYDLDPNRQNMQESAAVPEAEQPAPEAAAAAAEDDPAAMASQIISSNFKVGLSQDEVDALLNGMV
ncbi:MAG: hypothetical protein IKQ40_04665 [Lachnospiraceae bacterium]|nr:hypothetical protein [Lachnospiraceae bacterium]